DGALARARFVLRVGHNFLDLLDTGKHGAEGSKFRAREPRNQPRQRSLAAARRSPEEHGSEIVVFNLRAQRLAVAKQLFLPDEFVERARTHALRQRLMRTRHLRLNRLRQFGEEAHLWGALKLVLIA